MISDSRKASILAHMGRCDDKEEAFDILKKNTNASGSKSKFNPREAGQVWEELHGESKPPWDFLKPKPFPKSPKSRPAKSEEEIIHMTAVAELGCIVCREFLGRKNVDAQLHHLRENKGLAQRASHFDVIPLCPDHHLNGGHGVAYHAGSKTFVENFASEFELLKMVTILLAQKDQLGYIP